MGAESEIEMPTPELLAEWLAGGRVEREWWEAARQLGWRGPAFGFGYGVENPQDRVHLRDRFAVEETFRAWGWTDVVGLLLISASSRISDDSRYTVMTVPLDTNGDVIDRRQFPLGRGQQAAALLFVHLHVRTSADGRPMYHASMHIFDTVKNRQLDASQTTIDDRPVWVWSPYHAVNNALDQITDDDHRLRRADRLDDFLLPQGEEAPQPAAAPAPQPPEPADAPTAEAVAGDSDLEETSDLSLEELADMDAKEMTPAQKRRYRELYEESLYEELDNVEPYDPDADDSDFSWADEEWQETAQEDGEAVGDAVDRIENLTTEEALAEIRTATEHLNALLDRIEADELRLDPVEGAALLRDLLTTEANLSILITTLNMRADQHSDHHEAMGAATEEATAAKARAEDAKAVQDYLFNIASELSDLASLKSFRDEWREQLDPDWSGPVIEGTLGKLDSLFEGLKDLESALNTALEQVDDDLQSPVFNDLLGLSPALDKQIEELGGNPMVAIQTLKSTCRTYAASSATPRKRGSPTSTSPRSFSWRFVS